MKKFLSLKLHKKSENSSHGQSLVQKNIPTFTRYYFFIVGNFLVAVGFSSSGFVESILWKAGFCGHTLHQLLASGDDIDLKDDFLEYLRRKDFNPDSTNY